MKTPGEVYQEGFYSLDNETNPYLKNSWAWDSWNKGRQQRAKDLNSNQSNDKTKTDQQIYVAFVRYRNKLNALKNAIDEFAEASNNFNTIVGVWEESEDDFIICSETGSLDSGVLIKPYKSKLSINFEVHSIEALQNLVVTSPWKLEE